MGAMLGFGVAMTFITGGILGYTLVGIQAAGFIPSVRQSDVYKDILGYSSWLNPWAWPAHAIGATLFIADVVVYGGAYVFTWGNPPDWADLSISFEQGMVVTEGGVTGPRSGNARNFGAFTHLRLEGHKHSPRATQFCDTSEGTCLTMPTSAFCSLVALWWGRSMIQVGRNWLKAIPALSARLLNDIERVFNRQFGDVPWWNHKEQT